MVIISSMLGVANFDYHVNIWRRLLGPEVKLIANAEPVVSAYPSFASFDAGCVGSTAFTFGAAASALQRGVDGIHLFNHCPSKLLQGPEKSRDLHALYSDLVDIKAVAARPRRQAVTFPHVFAAGEPDRAVLPIPLRVPGIGIAFGRMEENITLRIMIGPKPVNGNVCLQLGFSVETPSIDPMNMTLRVNQVVCEPCATLPTSFAPSEDILRDFIHGDPPREAVQVLLYEVPLKVLQDDVNVVEFEPPQIEGKLVWAELLIDPVNGKEGL